jgi:cytochrome c peroxidase
MLTRCAAAFVLLAVPAFGQLTPPGAPPENPVTPEKAVLGKVLFWDEQLSSDNTMACGSCHRPFAGGADVRIVRLAGPDGVLNTNDDVFGSPGVIRSDAQNRYEPDPVHGFLPQVTGRNSPGFLMASYNTELFWDGRAPTTFVDPQTGKTSVAAGGALESQSVAPPTADVEMAHAARDWNEIVAKLAASRPLALASNLPPDVAAALASDPTYPDLFSSAFGDPAITSERIAFAIASYERSLVPDQTPWDSYDAGNTNALTTQQKAGLGVFTNQGNCSNCHLTPFFLDDQFHNIGLRDPATDPGRENVTGNHGDRGMFKTPSLRNVGLRARLMHTGQFTDLHQVVDFYNRGGDFSDNLDGQIFPLLLTRQQRDDLVEFLRNALTDPRVAAEQAPFDRPRLYFEPPPPNPARYGFGSPGTGGFVPTQLLQAPPDLGNVDFKFGLTQALGGSVALEILALDAAPPGTFLKSIPILVDLSKIAVVLAVPLNGTGAGGGYATLAGALPGDPALAGFEFYEQWFVLDAGAGDGIAASDGGDFQLF